MVTHTRLGYANACARVTCTSSVSRSSMQIRATHTWNT
ncbi:hypothetical protein C7S16_1980 [Burkholderia thailandensis]|uniref:Uncharacterized protein n=1 Tax=Burkholderia thailandensis TaxID=57975 RepID=A0AAW9D582_BURTH|nr:hypothetical protein [Burkholderia thailandensis]MDW9257148.1 hypothetical protein [Burkholderia thailandensis]